MEGIELHRRGQYAQDPVSGAWLPPPAIGFVHAAVQRPATLFCHFWRSELEGALARGRFDRLLAERVAYLAVCALLCAATLVAALHTEVTRQPYLLVFFVLGISCCLLALLFCSAKLHAALQLWRQPPKMHELRDFLTAGHGSFVPPPTPPGLPVAVDMQTAEACTDTMHRMMTHTMSMATTTTISSTASLAPACGLDCGPAHSSPDHEI